MVEWFVTGGASDLVPVDDQLVGDTRSDLFVDSAVAGETPWAYSPVVFTSRS